MGRLIGPIGRNRAIGIAIVVVAGMASSALIGTDAIGFGLVALLGMTFVAAIGRDPGAIRNPIADFYGPTTVNVLEGRVERGELLAEHAAFVRDQADRDVNVSTAMASFMSDVRERVMPKKVPVAIAAKATELRTELDAGEAAIKQLEDAAAVKRANSFPSPQYVADGERTMVLAPGATEMMNRLLDRLMRETVTKWRSIAVESARKGDDQPYVATAYFTPKLIRDEILDDERTMNALADIYTTRAGTKQWVASALMAASLARVLLEHTRGFIDSFAGADPGREAPLRTPDGREIRRRS